MSKAKSIFIPHQNSQIHCLRFGAGPELLFAFHGYADQAALFLPLRVALEKRYTIYSFDLPYHGQTTWSADRYQVEDVEKWINYILEKEQQSSFALLGYSYGGRVVQKIAPRFADQLSHIFLLAPDGIFTRGMINAHLVPQFIRVLLRRSLRRPDWLIAIVAAFHRIGLLSTFNLKFIRHHLSDTPRRQRLFNTWISMNDFILRPRQTKQFFRQSAIPVSLYFGRRDQAIPLRSGEWMADGVENVTLKVLEKGHRMISPELIRLMQSDH